jgi:hypothetical protein
MKRAILPIILFLPFLLVMISCSQEDPAPPCDGTGTLNIQNKLDSVITVKVTETHDQQSILKDYTVPFVLTGNNPYTLTIDGPQYHKDTTMMILNCDNKLLIVEK